MERRKYIAPATTAIDIVGADIMFTPGSTPSLPTTPDTPNFEGVKDDTPFDTSDLWDGGFE